MKRLKETRGITIIALVITIIVLLILVGISIYMMTGENGLITKARESSFRTEMKAIKESVNVKKQSNRILENVNINEKNELFTEQVTIDDAKKWDDYLLMEIIYWGQYEIDISSITKEYAKEHWKEILNSENTGEIDNLYYIDKETANGKEHMYLYDTKVDIVYKIPLTTIGSHKVHSIEELDYQKGITTGRTGTLIEDDCKMVEVDGISYYEPNLSGFILENTKLIYYNDLGNSTEVTAKEYFDNGKQRVIQKDGDNYELYNYKNQKWANILIENAGTSSYWVWIPRYSYNINLSENKTNVEFISLEDVPKEGYIVHSDFSDNKKGIWTSKYEPIQKIEDQASDFSYYIPDMTGFNKENTYIEIYDSTNNKFNETKLSSIDNLITFSRSSGWFDYKKQVWANIKVVNPNNNLETWWVWIPRYAYNITGNSTSIIFVDTNNNPLTGGTLPTNYTVHPAFEDGKKGIWVSKYEPINNVEITSVSSNVNPPDLRGYNVDNTYIECYDESTNEFKEQTLRSVLSKKSVIDEKTKIASVVDIDYSKINGMWYSYDKQIWANIKVVNPSNDLETWWVWIPRYAYNITGTQTNIIYLNSNGEPINGGTLPSNYISHPAFNESKEGIWTSKYEPIEK